MKTNLSSERTPEMRTDGIRKNLAPHVIRLTPKTVSSSPRAREESHEETAEGSEFLDNWQERHAAVAEQETFSDIPESPDEEMTFSSPESARVPYAGRHERAVSSARMKYVGAVCGFAVLVAAFTALTTVWARATVAVKPRVEEVALHDVAAVFDTSAAKVQIPERIIPAEKLLFAKTITKQFAATGKDSSAQKARGTVRITNAFGTSPQPLVAGTRLATSGGVLFRLVKSVTVPGAVSAQGKLTPQFIDAEAVADSAGEEGNLSGAVALTIPGFKGTPKYEGFSAVAPRGFAGGSRGAASVVTKDDLKRAEEETTKAVFGELKDEIGRSVPAGFNSPEELRTVEITKVEAPQAGAHVEKFTVTASAAGKALVYRPKDAEMLIKSFALEGTKDQDMVDGSARLAYRARSIDFAKGRADVAISGSVQIKAVINRDQLASLVAGKKEGSIGDLLRGRPDLAAFTLSIFPPWRSSAPGDTEKINLVLE